MTWLMHRGARRRVGDIAGGGIAERGPAVAAALAVVALAFGMVGAVGSPVLAQDAQGESSRVEGGEAVASGRVVVGDGHVDIGPRFLDGEWALLVRDDTVTPSVWRHLRDVVLQASDAAVVAVPDDPQFAFLGEPGADVWVLPQVQQQGILWPGWNTQDPDVATRLGRQVTWTLHGVEGPGDVVLFVNEDFGAPETLFDSREPYPQETGIEPNTHAHANWVFTAPGVYRLAMEMSGTTRDGDEVRGGGTLRVAVGDATNPDDAFAAPDLALPSDDAADAADADGDTRADDAAGDTDEPTGARSDGGRDAAADGGNRQAPADDDSTSAAPWLAVGGLAALLVGVIAAFAARRRTAGAGRRHTGADPREGGGDGATMAAPEGDDA